MSQVYLQSSYLIYLTIFPDSGQAESASIFKWKSEFTN